MVGPNLKLAFFRLALALWMLVVLANSQSILLLQICIDPSIDIEHWQFQHQLWDLLWLGSLVLTAAVLGCATYCEPPKPLAYRKWALNRLKQIRDISIPAILVGVLWNFACQVGWMTVYSILD